MSVQPRQFDYYLGIHEPSWLNHHDGVPKFISASRLDRIVSRDDRWPYRCVDQYAIDSGAYSALTNTKNRWTPWWLPAETYASKILSFATDTGRPPDFVAAQDWPCEPQVRASTGMTVREHQEETLRNYLFLTEEWPWIEWVPTLQGWEAQDYRVHERMYLDAGVDLAATKRVGIGSICRRGHVPEIVEVIEQFAESGYQLHGFGVKTTALPIFGHLLRSADSMAWSYDARYPYPGTRLDGCDHTGNCSNCYQYGLSWRQRVLAALSTTTEEAIVTAATTIKASAAQAAVITYYATGKKPADLPTGRGFQSAEMTCFTNRWIVDTDEAPYSAPTPAGIAAAGITATKSKTTTAAKEITVTTATEKKIRLNTYHGADAVLGADVRGGETIMCPKSGCARKVKTRKTDGKIGAHKMYASQACDLAGQPVPPAAMVDVISRRVDAVAAARAQRAQLFETVDDLLGKLTSGAALTPEIVVSDAAVPRIYDGAEAWGTRPDVGHYVEKRVDELQPHDVVACAAIGVAPLFVWNIKELVDEPGSAAQDGTKRYVVHGTRDGERPGEDHEMWGSTRVKVVSNGSRGWGPGEFDLQSKPTVQLKHEGPWLHVTKITFGGVYVREQKTIVAWSDIYQCKSWDVTYTRPGEQQLSRAMEDPADYYGYDGGPHEFRATFVGSLRCRECLGSIRSKEHTGILNADFDRFEKLRMDLLSPRQTNAGRQYGADHLDRYVRGIPLVRYDRDVDQQWTFVCPIDSCGGLWFGWSTVRGLRSGWLRHCAEKHAENLGKAPMWPSGWTPAWDYAEHPLEADIHFEVPAGISSDTDTLRRTAQVAVWEPKDDPSWAKLVDRFAAEGRSMSVEPVDAQLGRRRSLRTIQFSEGITAANALKAALVRAGIPKRDIDVIQASEPTRYSLAEVLATAYPPYEIQLSTGTIKDPARTVRHLDKDALNTLLHDTRQAEAGRVKAVVINDFSGKAIVIGPFDTPDAAQKWWGRSLNRIKSDASTHLVVLPYDGPAETKPKAKAAVTVVVEPLFDLDAFVTEMTGAAAAAPAEAIDLDAVLAEITGGSAVDTRTLDDVLAQWPVSRQVEQRRDAERILAEYDSSRDRQNVALWAMGVLNMSHGFWIHANWHCGDQMGVYPESRDELGLAGGRYLHSGKGGFTLYAGKPGGGRAVGPAKVTEHGWDQVLQMLCLRATKTRRAVPERVVALLDEAIAMREAASPGKGASQVDVRSFPAGADKAGDDAREAAEQRTRAVGCEVWHSIRPAN